MIGACFLPHPPLLLAEYASLGDPGAGLRARCRATLGELAALGPDRLVLLSGAPRVRPAVDSRAPLGLRVARELLAGTALPVPQEELVVPFDAQAGEVAVAARRLRELGRGRGGVVVLGDGSARRSESAPGYLDERAVAADTRIAAALSAGQRGPLADLDATLAAELMIAGRAAWQVLAGATVRAPDRATAHAEDPFGVVYHVALWQWEHDD